MHVHVHVHWMVKSTHTLDEDALTLSFDLETDDLDDEEEEEVADKEFIFLDWLIDGEPLGDVLSPLFSLNLAAWTGLGELPADVEPILVELELEEVDEGIVERPPWSLEGGEERLFIIRPLCLAGRK